MKPMLSRELRIKEPPNKTQDVLTTFHFDEDDIPVTESPDDLESKSKEFRKNWKLSTRFEQ